MPVVHDWSFANLATNPYVVIDHMIDQYREDGLSWDEKIAKVVQRCNFLWLSLKGDELKQIPLLNNLQNHQLEDGQVVRFRCMIQDMYDPEIYLGAYNVKNLKSGEVKEKSGVFRDIVSPQTFEVALYDDTMNTIMQRRLFYCISVPGENSWVNEGWATHYDIPVTSSMTADPGSPESNKRRLDEENLDDELWACRAQPDVNLRADVAPESTLLDETLFNFPLPNMFGHGKACIVKDFGVDPEEQRVHNPPTSLIPRLHLLGLRKIQDINPAISISQDAPMMCNDLANARLEMKKFLGDLLLGDELCSEYLMMNLVSRVVSRTGTHPVGKLSINFLTGALPSCSETHEEFLALVYKVLQSLVPKSFRLDLNLDSLNTSAFAPKKDYKANRLTSGLLQLSEGTILLIDDTMREGQLNQTGISNMACLSILNAEQKVDYEFQYHKLEFHADVPIIVLSERRSILSCDAVLPILAQYDANGYKDAKNRIMSRLEDQAFMTRMRDFLSVIRLKDSYSLEEPIQLAIQEEFVRSRNTPGEEGLTQDDLNTHLGISRLLCHIHGKESLDLETWEKVRSMELERKNRLKENCHN